jgi:hypothetical protein
MQTNAVLTIHREIAHLRRLLRASDARMVEEMQTRLLLRLELRSAEQRYQDALESSRLKAQGREAVEAAVEWIENDLRDTL